MYHYVILSLCNIDYAVCYNHVYEYVTVQYVGFWAHVFWSRLAMGHIWNFHWEIARLRVFSQRGYSVAAW